MSPSVSPNVFPPLADAPSGPDFCGGGERGLTSEVYVS